MRHRVHHGPQSRVRWGSRNLARLRRWVGVAGKRVYRLSLMISCAYLLVTRGLSHAIAFSANGIDELFVFRKIYLLPQIVNVNVNQVAISFHLVAPAFTQQFLAAHSTPAPAQQQREQIKLLRAELDLALPAVCLSSGRIEFQILYPQYAERGICFPPQQSIGAGREFLKGEGLGNVIVRAQVERLHTIIDLVRALSTITGVSSPSV